MERLYATTPCWQSEENGNRQLTDFWKASDSLPHEVLIAELIALGFRLGALELMNNCLSQRNQRTNFNESFSSWQQIIFGVFFSIIHRDFFLILNDFDIASDTDDITLYKVCDNVDATVKNLRKSTKNLFKWSKENQMKGNTVKCYLILNKGDSNQIQTRNLSIEGSIYENSLVSN